MSHKQIGLKQNSEIAQSVPILRVYICIAFSTSLKYNYEFLYWCNQFHQKVRHIAMCVATRYLQLVCKICKELLRLVSFLYVAIIMGCVVQKVKVFSQLMYICMHVHGNGYACMYSVCKQSVHMCMHTCMKPALSGRVLSSYRIVGNFQRSYF